ncbi:potassium voltage-gated channel subfamily E member 3 isoform X2 [Saccopteryx leptura]|uniref:potassium voltage-gated channel subfamily E member 3 isoform X2 n=1 Tax=Saccopteryx leptura TaxID=249018 RepID=UPI00339C723C
MRAAHRRAGGAQCCAPSSTGRGVPRADPRPSELCGEAATEVNTETPGVQRHLEEAEGLRLTQSQRICLLFALLRQRRALEPINKL